MATEATKSPEEQIQPWFWWTMGILSTTGVIVFSVVVWFNPLTPTKQPVSVESTAVVESVPMKSLDVAPVTPTARPEPPEEEYYPPPVETESYVDTYGRDVAAIKSAVLADTISPRSAVFCPRFEVMTNARGNRVYVGWYRSADLRGVVGQDNIVAEVDYLGNVVLLSIGDF